MPTQPTPTSLQAALVAALAEMPAINRGQSANVQMKGGGSFSYSYADLATVLGEVKPILAKHGLAVVQDVTGGQGNRIGVTTIIIHESGETMEFGPLPMPGSDNPQALGSAITYARRYAVLAALGIATEDDDGSAASNKSREDPTPYRDPNPANEEPSWPKPITDLFDRVVATKDTPKADELKAAAIENHSRLTVQALAEEPKWAELVEAILDAPSTEQENTDV